MAFLDKLGSMIQAHASLLCVGLDPEPARLPGTLPRTPQGVLQFNRAIIEATADLVCAYKPNLAFYEALGIDGAKILSETLRSIPAGIPIIADAKRGDIGNTARAYATAIFDQFGFDAVTVNPYMGEDAIVPFLAYTDRGVLVLVRTSNPSASSIQNLMVEEDGARRPLYEIMARRVRSWNRHGNAGLVVGATAPEELRRIRELAPDLPLLIPAVGTQGGDIGAAVAAHRPHAPAIINVSRAVLYASAGDDFAQRARATAQELREALAPQRG